ncbi:hypothetical protein OG250_41995 [Streptomyces sp. NBC_00487]|uniref:hypothetical protein n=1 Tax=unclassified Streptomyces TaxID=2593676 RepID=UPI002E18040D|nr:MULTISPECIES: hypothetical protein [unclassified Streptomyces]
MRAKKVLCIDGLGPTIGSKPAFLEYREIGSATTNHRCIADEIIRGLKNRARLNNVKRKMFRALLVGGLVSASVAVGIASSYAIIEDPTNAGISEEDWAKFVQLGNYNGALVEFVDDNGVPEMVFPAGSTALTICSIPRAGSRGPPSVSTPRGTASSPT